MADVGEQLRTLPMKKILALLVVIALVITAGILLMTWSQKADQQLLFANLSEEDAGAIIQKLNEQKIPYTTTGGGIMVPSDKVYEVRLQLASQGLPQGGGVGFELFDKTSFTMSDFVQKLNYRRALQGELSRTIRSLAEVEECRVHLAIPEKTLFMQKDEKPKASVLLKLRPGRRLSQSQVQGIVHLVSSSIEGLDANDVTVVNNDGDMLTAAVDENFVETGGQFEYQRNYEHDVETKVISMLEPVVGKGKVKVRVAANFDFTKTEKTEEKYDPDSQVARSEQKNTEKSTGGTSGGVPGIASNLPGRQQTAAALPGNPAVSEKKSETINYELTKTISHVISPTGEIKKLSAVVLVDGTYAAAKGSKETKYVPRTEDEVKQFEDMVKNAVGFNADRGDQIKVVNLPFEVTPQEDMVDTPVPSRVMPTVMTASKYFVPFVGVMLLFLFVVKPLMKTLTESAPLALPQPQLSLTQAVGERQRAIPDQERSSSREQLVDWAKKNPKDASNLIKGWLEEK
jgi:flagellar M-ring protein FliF